jgi:hypothetical protein
MKSQYKAGNKIAIKVPPHEYEKRYPFIAIFWVLKRENYHHLISMKVFVLVLATRIYG